MTLMNDTQQSLNGRMKIARIVAGLEQAELAEMIGVARSSISNWERGTAEPSATNFVRLARATGQPLEWLAEGIEVRPERLELPTF